MVKILRVLIFLCLYLGSSGVFLMANSLNDEKGMTEEEYQKALIMQNKIHGFIRAASQCEKNGQYEAALENFLKAYEINRCAGLVAVCRGGIADNYEALGEYQKALDYVDVSLGKLSAHPQQPSYKKYAETKSRLLKKIEEQKNESGAKKMTQDSSQSDYARQRKFLESMKTQGVATAFKEATLFEHAGKFADARKVYEKLLLQRETIAREMTLENWVMLYPAIQRTSELIGDETREKETLVWIKGNMLDPQGQFHGSLSKIMPAVIDHLNKQIKKYQLR